MRLERAQIVYRFRIGTLACLQGYAKRLIQGKLKVERTDITDGCEERLDWDFLKFIAGFSRNQEKQTDEILKKYPDVKVITFRSRKQAERYLDKLESHYGQK